MYDSMNATELAKLSLTPTKSTTVCTQWTVKIGKVFQVHVAFGGTAEIEGETTLKITGTGGFGLGAAVGISLTGYVQGDISFVFNIPKALKPVNALAEALRHFYHKWLFGEDRLNAKIIDRLDELYTEMQSVTKESPSKGDDNVIDLYGENMMEGFVTFHMKFVSAIKKTYKTGKDEKSWNKVLEDAFKETAYGKHKTFTKYPKCSEVGTDAAHSIADATLCSVAKYGTLLPSASHGIVHDGSLKNILPTIHTLYPEWKVDAEDGQTIADLHEIFDNLDVSTATKAKDHLKGMTGNMFFQMLASKPAVMQEFLKAYTDSIKEPYKMVGMEAALTLGITIGSDPVGFCTPDGNLVQASYGREYKLVSGHFEKQNSAWLVTIVPPLDVFGFKVNGHTTYDFKTKKRDWKLVLAFRFSTDANLGSLTLTNQNAEQMQSVASDLANWIANGFTDLGDAMAEAGKTLKTVIIEKLKKTPDFLAEFKKQFDKLPGEWKTAFAGAIAAGPIQAAVGKVVGALKAAASKVAVDPPKAERSKKIGFDVAIGSKGKGFKWGGIESISFKALDTLAGEVEVPVDMTCSVKVGFYRLEGTSVKLAM